MPAAAEIGAAGALPGRVIGCADAAGAATVAPDEEDGDCEATLALALAAGLELKLEEAGEDALLIFALPDDFSVVSDGSTTVKESASSENSLSNKLSSLRRNMVLSSGVIIFFL